MYLTNFILFWKNVLLKSRPRCAGKILPAREPHPHPHRKTAPRTRTGKPHRSKCLTTIFYFVFPFFQLSRTSDLVAGFDQNKNLWFLGVYGEYWSPFVRYCKRLLVLLTWRRIEPKNKDQYDVNLCSCWNDNFLRVLLLIVRFDFHCSWECLQINQDLQSTDATHCTLLKLFENYKRN